MKEEKKIGVSILTRASEKGAGLYLYMPAEHARTYDISKGDKVELRLIRRFREVPDRMDPNIVDISEVEHRSPRKKK